MYLLPGVGVPPDHDCVPAHRVQGEWALRALDGRSWRCDRTHAANLGLPVLLLHLPPPALRGD